MPEAQDRRAQLPLTAAAMMSEIPISTPAMITASAVLDHRIGHVFELHHLPPW
jgi:hypothetical protein